MSAQEYVLDRTGDRALRFKGTFLGGGQSGLGGQDPGEWTRGHTVRIYRTESGSYVVHRARWVRVEGELPADAFSEAIVVERTKLQDNFEAAHRTLTGAARRSGPEYLALDLLAALRGKAHELRPAELEAWKAACAADAGLRDHLTEEVL